jgi:UDP-N-acetylglucosamine 2-epimerase (non-hydrolysing)
VTKKKIICIFGTRPEAIKMAPLALRLKKEKNFIVKVVVTAQHRHMLDQVLDLFKLKSDYDLNIMTYGQSLYHISNRVLLGIGEILQKEKPDLILVHGDTTTTMMASLAGYYEKTAVGHVEAGLRSYDKLNPFPEEVNRIITDNVSTIFFAPTLSSKKNLLKENIKKNIFITGNTVIDALLMVVKNISKNKYKASILKKIDLKNKKIILVTVHRRENWGKPLENICNGILEISKKFSDVEFIMPVHLNPNVKNVVNKILGGKSNIHLLDPMDYVDIVSIMNNSHIVLTDSGGLQEEAPSLGKPVLVLRKVTERPEAVRAGTVKLVGTDTKKIVDTVSKLLTNKKIYNRMANTVNPYGDGNASERTTCAIKYLFGMTRIKPEEFNG